MVNSFAVVEAFERRVAKFAGAKYAVSTNTGTSALFLSCRLRFAQLPAPPVVIIPAHTFISVPMAILQAAGRVQFSAAKWTGTYLLKPFDIVDGALRFRRGMYEGGLHCLSFHARKLLNIGEGGMVLTDNYADANWLRAARYSGRRPPFYCIQDVTTLGWQLYMTPEKAARGLHLMDYIREDLPDQKIKYVDLRTVPFFFCSRSRRAPTGAKQ